MNKGHFNQYSKYYNLLYEDKDYLGEANYVYNKLLTYNPAFKSILELGMGTGNHAKLLKEKGVKVTGIELSKEMAEQARANGVECHIGDCSYFHLDETFDVAISLFHVMSYITENEKLLTTFKNIYQHLNSNGLFLFDVWYSPAIYNLIPEVRVKRIENEEIIITRIAEPTIHYNENIVDVNYEVLIEDKLTRIVTRFNEKHPMRHFSIPEIDVLAIATGFEVINAEEWMTNNNPSQNTWGVCFTLKKGI